MFERKKVDPKGTHLAHRRKRSKYLTLSRVCFETVTEYWKKSKNIACDVTVQNKKIKLYVQIACQLGYIMMLISIGICRYEGKYAVLNRNICHFLGP